MALHERRYRSRFTKSSYTPPPSTGEESESAEKKLSETVQNRYSVTEKVRNQAPRKEIDVQRIIMRALPIAIVLGIVWYLVDNFVL